MGSKSSVILEKVSQDRRRGDFEKALKRLAEGIAKMPREVVLYKEAIDVALEAGESRQSIQFFKMGQKNLPTSYEELWHFATDKVKTFNDPILCKFLLDLAIRKRELEAAEGVLENLKDHTAGELLKRTRTKKRALTAAMSGGVGMKGELTVNALSEAMLCLRCKRFPEAVQVFLRVLDEKPIEHEAMVPFFLSLEKNHSKKGIITYASGCCQLAAENYRNALTKIVQGVILTPSIADDAIARLAPLKDNNTIDDDEIDLRLARLFIIKGDSHHAAESITSMLAQSSGLAPLVLDLLDPHVETIGDNLILDYLYIEAALLANRNERALAHVQKIYQVARHRPDLLAWLDTKSQERFMPVEVLHFHGEIALDQHLYERAVEIFKDVLSQSSQDAPAITELLSNHLSDPAVRRYHDELSGIGPQEKQQDEFSIEHFQNQEFTLETGASHEPAPPPDPVSSSDDPFERKDPEPSRPVEKDRNVDEPSPQRDPGIVLDDDRPQLFGLGEKRPDAKSNTINLGFEVDRPVFGGFPGGQQTPPAPPETEEPGPDDATPTADRREPDRRDRRERRDRRDEEPSQVHEEPVAGQTETDRAEPAPAAPVSDDTPEPPQVILLGVSDLPEPTPEPTPAAPPQMEPVPKTEPPVARPVAPPVTPPVAQPVAPPVAQPVTPPVADPEPALPDFQTLFDKSERGELDRGRTLELIEQGLRLGKLNEVKALLSFKPDNVGEDIKRKFYLADYYIGVDLPMTALIILKSVHMNSLSKEQRKRFLIKIAYCYQSLGRYDAAHATYLRIMTEDPEFASVERMATLNYERYMRTLSGDAPVLEKVTRI